MREGWKNHGVGELCHLGLCFFQIVAEVMQSDNLGVGIPIILLSFKVPINNCKHMKETHGTIYKNWLNNTGEGDEAEQTVSLCWQDL